MMVNIHSVKELSRRGLQALEDELGAVGTMLFLRQFSENKGNYTEERQKILKERNIYDIANEIKEYEKDMDC